VNRQPLDIGRSLTYMFEEEDWIAKFLIAVGMVLLSILILPYLILQGYLIEIIRRVGRNQTTVLPAWTNWGDYLKDGLFAALALFVYTIPAILPACCMAFFAAAFTDQQTGELSGFGVLAICCISSLVIILSLLIYLVYFAGLIRYAETGEFASFFQFGRLWAYVRENGSNYAYAILIIVIANIIAGFIPILGTAWATLVTGHVLGQVMRAGGGLVGGPTPPSEVPAL
jgi:hypothetical protein